MGLVGLVVVVNVNVPFAYSIPPHLVPSTISAVHSFPIFTVFGTPKTPIFIVNTIAAESRIEINVFVLFPMSSSFRLSPPFSAALCPAADKKDLIYALKKHFYYIIIYCTRTQYFLHNFHFVAF